VDQDRCVGPHLEDEIGKRGQGQAGGRVVQFEAIEDPLACLGEDLPASPAVSPNALTRNGIRDRSNSKTHPRKLSILLELVLVVIRPPGI